MHLSFLSQVQCGQTQLATVGIRRGAAAQSLGCPTWPWLDRLDTHSELLQATPNPTSPKDDTEIFQSKIWKRHFGKVLPFFIWKWSLRRMPGATTSAKRLQFAGAFPSTLMLHVCLQCIQLEHKPRFCPGMTLMSPVSRGFLILASLASASHRFIRARDPC